MDLKFFSRSIFIPRKDAEIVSKKIAEIMSFFLKETSSLNGKMYYTGSLGREEPSITYSKNKPKLFSDLDFVFIGKKKNMS